MSYPSSAQHNSRHPLSWTASPEDFLEFCPISHMDDEDTKHFYVYLLSSIAELESSFNPDRKYEETIKNRQGQYVVSRGLLQLSLESANGYGCGFRSAKAIHDPEQNLRCGVRILSRWVGGDGRIAGMIDGHWQGGARYWNVLRLSEKLEQIKTWTSTYCIQRFGSVVAI